jgi:hypothetical protein
MISNDKILNLLRSQIIDKIMKVYLFFNILNMLNQNGKN